MPRGQRDAPADQPGQPGRGGPESRSSPSWWPNLSPGPGRAERHSQGSTGPQHHHTPRCSPIAS